MCRKNFISLSYNKKGVYIKIEYTIWKEPFENTRPLYTILYFKNNACVKNEMKLLSKLR